MTILKSGRGVTRASLAGLCAVLLLAAQAGVSAAHPSANSSHGKPAITTGSTGPTGGSLTEHGSQSPTPAQSQAEQPGHSGNARGVGHQASSQGNSQGKGAHGEGHGQGHENRGQSNSEGKGAHGHGNSAHEQSSSSTPQTTVVTQNPGQQGKGAHGEGHGQGHGNSAHSRSAQATPTATPAKASPTVQSSPQASAAAPVNAPATSTAAPAAPVLSAHTTQAARSRHHARRHRGAARSHAPRRHPARRTPTRTSAGTITTPALTAPVLLAHHSHSPAAGAPATRGRSQAPKTGNPLTRIGRHIPLPLPVPDWSKPIILVLLLLSVWLAVRSRLSALRARRLENQRAALQRQLEVMQAALVPAVPQRLGDLAVSVAYRPASGPAAGGDFYDLFALTPGKVAVVLGDVAGHGEEALTHAALTRYTLRAYLQAGLEPRSALALAGRVLADPEGERFATVAVGVFAARSGTLTYALAGHHPPIVSAPHIREPITSCASPPVGWGAPTGRRQTVISLPAGSEVCFFSDGLIEARREDGLLGRERLEEILAELGPRPQATDLLEQVRDATDATPDDMVACVVAPQTPTLGELIHVEELLVDSRSLTGADVRRFLRECRLSSDEVKRTMENARAVVASSGEALLRIQLASHAATVSVLAPGSGAADAPRVQSQADRGVLQTLPAG